MPISKSAIEAALLKMQKLSQVAPQQVADPLERLLGKISLMKGDRGEPGPEGKPGRTPIKYVDYFTKKEVEQIAEMATPVKDKDYFDGVDGKDGRDGVDGKDGNANIEEVRTIAEGEVSLHESLYDHKKLVDQSHEKKVLGDLELDESAVDGKFLFVRGKRIIGADAPKSQIVQMPYRGGVETHRRYRVKSITSSQTLDPLDDVTHVDATSGNITVTIYSAAGNEGNHHYFKRTDTSANTVSFAMTGSETIDYDTLYQLVNRGSGAEIYNDGTNWFIKHIS